MNLAQKFAYFDGQVAKIWRRAPDSKEQAGIIYKINHAASFIEDNAIVSTGTYQNFELKFPFLPRVSITYFKINDISVEELESIKKAAGDISDESFMDMM